MAEKATDRKTRNYVSHGRQRTPCGEAVKTFCLSKMEYTNTRQRAIGNPANGLFCSEPVMAEEDNYNDSNRSTTLY